MHVFENRYDRHENSNFYKRAIDTRKKSTYEQTKKEYSKLTKGNKSLYKISKADDGVLLNEPETPENTSVK